MSLLMLFIVTTELTPTVVAAARQFSIDHSPVARLFDSPAWRSLLNYGSIVPDLELADHVIIATSAEVEDAIAVGMRILEEVTVGRAEGRLLNGHALSSESRRPTPIEKAGKGVSKEEANVRVRQWLYRHVPSKLGAQEVRIRNVASDIGCSTGLVHQTSAWQHFQARREETRQSKPRTISYDDNKGDGVQDESLRKLMNDSNAENEKNPSPLQADDNERRGRRGR